MYKELRKIKMVQFSCVFCNYKTDSENSLKVHIRANHDWKCKACDLAFETNSKLDGHICKTNIRHPTYGNLYINNWILTKGCTPIFNNCTKKKVVNIHHKDCWRRICPCPELKPNISDRIPVDENEVLHCNVSRFVRNGLVNWPQLVRLMENN